MTDMPTEITVKTLLSPIKKPEEWLMCRHAFDAYRGCPFGCVYCDAAGVGDGRGEGFAIKINAAECLGGELSSKRRRGMLLTGLLSDPYNPAEESHRLTRACMKTALRLGFMLCICTKSDMILRDRDLFSAYPGQVAALFSFVTADPALGARLEPRSPPPEHRFAAMGELTRRGVPCGAVISPVLPFVTDSRDNISEIIAKAASYGAAFVVPFFGVRTGERQREGFFRRMEHCCPGIASKYVNRFGGASVAMSPHHAGLSDYAASLCGRLGVAFGTEQAVSRLMGSEQLRLM